MKAVYALTLAILGAEAYVLPAGAAPKANYALRPSTNNAPVSNGGFASPNKNAAGTKIKFTPGGSSGGKTNNVLPGFIAPSKRSKSDDDYEVGEGAQKSDDGDEEGVMFTTFSSPHFKIGTPKEDDAADTKERKFKSPSTKKQNGKKQKQTSDDDSATKTDDKPKTSASAKPKKDEKKAAKQTEKEKKAAAKQAEKDKKAAAKQAEKDKKKEAKKAKAEDKKKKPSSDDDDDDSATKTDDDQPKATAVAKKASHKSHSHSS
ncbi:uncharacterized protein B0J16DRAFT_418633 [Fusarium flagelliforme]|uniref:uncharacterized protein n=1 Tax=Fusarium flagelliforme TaxID=2675880 RepID=UPI001E8D45B0|nr:uncharacterized protein B0J16DRAFT_418633 [Fusarium flagelliforme]KAH7173327.1 hypothetical protein B0J16DRAFT_418633 [Fusarium flagelliforme]